jgi:hypothetical protein
MRIIQSCGLAIFFNLNDRNLFPLARRTRKNLKLFGLYHWLDATNWYCSPEGWKRTYNEMVELWGSLYELTAYCIRGALPQDSPNHSTLVTFLRKALLFELEPIHS